MRRGEKEPSPPPFIGHQAKEPSPSPSPSIGHQTWEPFPFPSIGHQEKEPSPSPSIGHQTWNIPLATKHWNIHLATKLWIYLHLPFPSLEKANSDRWGFFLSPDIIFN